MTYTVVIEPLPFECLVLGNSPEDALYNAMQEYRIAHFPIPRYVKDKNNKIVLERDREYKEEK